MVKSRGRLQLLGLRMLRICSINSDLVSSERCRPKAFIVTFSCSRSRPNLRNNTDKQTVVTVEITFYCIIFYFILFRPAFCHALNSDVNKARTLKAKAN